MLLHFRYLTLVLLQDYFDEKKNPIYGNWLFDNIYKLFIQSCNVKTDFQHIPHGISNDSHSNRKALFGFISFSFLSNKVNCIPDK